MTHPEHRPTEPPDPAHAGLALTASTRDRVTGLDIRVDRAGSGRPLVVLNGLLGLNVHWFGVLPRLVDRAECLLVQPPLLEMRGPACSVGGVTRLVASVIESLTDEPAVIAGNSLGGHVGLRLALDRPELVRGLVLVGSSGLFERGFEKGVEHSPSRQWLERKIGELFHDPGRMWPSMIDDSYAELSRRTSARALVKLGRSAKNDHLGERLGEVGVPTLIAWGRNDVVTPPEVAIQFSEQLPDARLRWIDRCGHAPQVEQPEALGAHIAEFLDELAASDSERAGPRAAAG